MMTGNIFSRILTIAFHDPKFLAHYFIGTVCAAIYCNFVKEPIHKKIEGKINFEFDFSLDPNIKKMYFGIYEYETVKFLKSQLKPGDTFIDIGANIGFLSAIGAVCVGPKGQIHSFEPVPDYFSHLQKLANENPDYSINVNQYACGNVEGKSTIDLPNDGNIGWNTMVPSFIEEKKKSYEIEIHRLDNYIKGKNLHNVTLIKIDVEGYEFPVLKGLEEYLDLNNNPIFLVEIVPGAYPLLGYTLDQLSKFLERYQYSCVSLTDQKSQVDIRTLSDTTNVIFFPQNIGR